MIFLRKNSFKKKTTKAKFQKISIYFKISKFITPRFQLVTKNFTFLNIFVTIIL